MRKAIEEYNMIDEGDKIAVCLSGGKDSITMLNGLKALQRFYPKHFELIAISVNPGFDFFDTEILQKNCDEIGVPLIIENSDIKEIVFDVRKEKNPCSLCANLRRGIINSVAIREGCNKIALGHNMDDVLETFLLNMLYTGSLSTFATSAFAMNQTDIIAVTVQDDYKEIKTTAIPQAVKDALATDYKSATLNKAYVNHKQEYKLEITVDGAALTVYADKDGNWIVKD